MSREATILRSAAYLPVPDVANAGDHYRDVLGFGQVLKDA